MQPAAQLFIYCHAIFLTLLLVLLLGFLKSAQPPIPIGFQRIGHQPIIRINKRAAVAIAHKILVAIYHMLSQQVSYNDLGDLYLDKLNKHHLTRTLVHRLERLGYQVTLTLQEKAA
jgi:hypothetical protein